MRVLDLFSGIGGFSLGLERAGMRTVAFCEIEPYCRAVLRKHWPDVPIYEDIRTLTAAKLAADGIGVDLICGGFPCQDISSAGKGAGIEGARSGLWSEYARIVREVRPRFIIVENVAALLANGIDRVLGDLAALGYDAEWHCIPASAIGAPHRRDRVWIVAFPDRSLHARELADREGVGASSGSESGDEGERQTSYRERIRSEPLTSDQAMAVAASVGLEGTKSVRPKYDFRTFTRDGRRDVSDARCLASQIPIERQLAAIELSHGDGWWEVEPDVGRVAHGVPNRVDRLKGLGNAVVPQIPEIIGRAIMMSLPPNA